MNKSEKAKEKLLRAIAEIDKELVAPSDHRGIPESQVTRFRSVLSEMLDEVESDHVPHPSSRRAGIGRVIVDSWPNDCPLGQVIIDAEQAYADLVSDA